MSLLLLPFTLIGWFFALLTRPFTFIIDLKRNLILKIGNKLLNASKEAKDGVIRNRYILDAQDVFYAYKKLEAERIIKEEE